VANCQALTASLAEEGMRPVSGGTDTHLALLDLRGIHIAAGRGVNGREAEQRCERMGIILNRNAIPYDTAKPMLSSGIRVGTAAVTTQGMREPEMKVIANLVARAVRSPEPAVADEVSELVSRFPLYS
jgi:glycine hydroxymethyltransferase